MCEVDYHLNEMRTGNFNISELHPPTQSNCPAASPYHNQQPNFSPSPCYPLSPSITNVLEMLSQFKIAEQEKLRYIEERGRQQVTAKSIQSF